MKRIEKELPDNPRDDETYNKFWGEVLLIWLDKTIGYKKNDEIIKIIKNPPIKKENNQEN